VGAVPRRVGINALYLVPGQVGGTQLYAVELIRSLATAHPDCEFTVFCGPEAAPMLRSRGFAANVRVRPLALPSRIKPLRLLQELLLLPLHARAARIELLHSFGNTAPLFGCGARVLTVHDVIFHRFPNTFPRAARIGLELIVPRSARRSRSVIADSQSTKDDLVEFYSIDPAKIAMVHIGPGLTEPAAPTAAAELTTRYRLGDRPVVLTIAAALEHKNLGRLFEAVALLAHEGMELDLVLAGHPGLEFDRMRALAGELGIAERIHLTGWVTDEDLSGLYALADCFVYPTLFEGFGLPALEAMQRGVPLASSTGGSLGEIVGDGALTFDPTDVPAIAGAIRTLIEDRELAGRLVQRGRAVAAGFTWEKTAQACWAVYLEALGR
jgi:glycosyltransferase involved in cell wall biosynthesis